MADIKTQCPHCGVRYWVDEQFTGESVECEECGRTFVIVPLATRQELRRETREPNMRAAEPPRTKDADLFSTAKNNEIVIPTLDLVLIRIEPGSFVQGAADGYAAEDPPHTVHITAPFWIGRTPVTQAQYQEIMGKNPSYEVHPDNPVETVSWYEAREFCQRLTEREILAGRLPQGARFRLPTEAQWEYACRTAPPVGPSRGRRPTRHPTTTFCFGDDPDQLEEYAWFRANSKGRPHPVATRKPSPRGLYDLHGNVGEWCLDWFAPYSAGEQTDPDGPPEGTRKVRRGGSWASVARRCRGADRIGVLPGVRCALLGFRIVLIEP